MVAIKGLEMPQNCGQCGIEWCKLWKECEEYERHPDCPLVEVPDQIAETNIFDTEETYHGCTVQVLSNSVTGETSIGWWRSDGSD